MEKYILEERNFSQFMKFKCPTHFLSAESEDDEFFDAEETMGISEETTISKPQGRLRKCGRLRLLKTGEPMYIPITQVNGKSYVYVDLEKELFHFHLTCGLLNWKLLHFFILKQKSNFYFLTRA
jgi:hypothetical protein